jgi:PAS domain S-box-containing protein
VVKGTVTYGPAEFQGSLLKAISKNSLDFIAVVKSSNRQVVYINEKGAKLFGYKKASELINKTAPFLRKKKLSGSLINSITKKIAADGYYTDEVEYITRSGKNFWGRLQLNPFISGGINYLLVQIEKIDRAKMAEEKLQKEKQRFGALLDYASIAVVIVNRKQHIILMNPCALELFGYSLNEVSGKKLDMLIPARYHRRHHTYHNQYYSEPQNRSMGQGRELTAIKKNGIEFPVEVSLGTYQTEGETYVIAYLSDITLRKKSEKEIIQLNAVLETKIKERTDELADTIKKLEHQVKQTEATQEELKKSLEKEKELNLLKSRFVSIASHEFRTPLSTILSSTYLLQKYVNTDEQPKRDKHIERIVSSVNMLTDILNDFLSVGKIEEGKIAPNYSQFNIRNKILEVVEETKGLLKKGQQVNCTGKGKKDVWLDASMIKHIVMNLLSNAIKFSPENSTIKIETASKNKLLFLSVTDEGIGISKEDRQHLFERFYRGSNANNIPGTGLGLHIVKKYAELMNGDVTCISELEKGSTFIATFRLSKIKG